MKRYLFCTFLIIFGFLTQHSTVFAQTPGLVRAFPDAEGFGATAKGGRGGTVIEVTNVNDSGAGSLRACVIASGPRICVFRIGGTIILNSSLDILHPFLTIAGQTAPGGGITLRSSPTNTKGLVVIRPTASDVVIRYIRVRTGEPSNVTGTFDTLDAVTINSQRVILDHVSLSWGTDETLNTWYATAQDITVQWSIISEGLSNSLHTLGEHSKGWLMGEFNKNITAHHNLFAHNMDRHPEMKGDPSGTIETINNVIYNYGKRISLVSDNNGKVRVNYIGNYIKPGPDSKSGLYELTYYNSTGQGVSMFVKGNIGPHRQSDTNQQFTRANGGEWSVVNSPDSYLTTTKHPGSTFPVEVSSAQIAYDQVISDVGARYMVDCNGNFIQRRDAVDERIIRDVMNGTGSIIDNQNQVGGWPELSIGIPCTDTDHDGMPDQWEQSYGLNKQVNDSSLDKDNNGYTNLEEYLNGGLKQTPEISLTPSMVPEASSPTPSSSPCRLLSRGDATCDDKILQDDFDLWLKEFMGEISTIRSDFISDGSITLTDFEVWRRNFE